MKLKRKMLINNQLLDIENIKNSKKPILDLFIRRTSVLTSTSENLVEKIIKDQWANANKITQLGSPVSEIDITNIGTLYISKSKAKRRLKKIKEYIATLPESESVQISNYEEMMKSIKIKTKLNNEC